MTLTDGKEFTAEFPDAAGSHFDGCLTLEGTQQLMVLFSASRNAGTSLCCPGKRHLRTFCDCTEHPVQVVLTMTVSVAICLPLWCRRRYPVRTPLPMLSSFGESFMRTQASFTDFIPQQLRFLR